MRGVVQPGEAWRSKARIRIIVFGETRGYAGRGVAMQCRAGYGQARFGKARIDYREVGT